MANTWVLSATKLANYRAILSNGRMTAASGAVASMVVAHNLGQSPHAVRAIVKSITAAASGAPVVLPMSWDASQVYLSVQALTGAVDVQVDVDCEVVFSLNQ